MKDVYVLCGNWWERYYNFNYKIVFKKKCIKKVEDSKMEKKMGISRLFLDIYLIMY